MKERYELHVRGNKVSNHRKESGLMRAMMIHAQKTNGSALWQTGHYFVDDTHYAIINLGDDGELHYSYDSED